MEIVVEFEHRMEVCSGEAAFPQNREPRWLITLVEPIHPLLFLVVISLRIALACFILAALWIELVWRKLPGKEKETTAAPSVPDLHGSDTAEVSSG